MFNFLKKTTAENEEMVDGLNTHEIKSDILSDYERDFEMICDLITGRNVRKTHNNFGVIIHYEAYINAKDMDYDSEDRIFQGVFLELDTPVFSMINRSINGKGVDFKHEIIEYKENNCYIPMKGFCFIKCIKFATGLEYLAKCVEFFRNEK